MYNPFAKVWDGLKSGMETAIDTYNRPYDQAKGANLKAGQDIQNAANTAMGMGQQGMGRALDQTMPAARQWHNTYEGEGGLAGPGAVEQRYSDRMAGTDKFANFQRAEGAKSLSDSFSARGLNNSGAALRAQALMNAKIDADSQGQMDSLANAAQGAKESRLGGAFDRLQTLGATRAGTVERGTQGMIDTYTAGQLGGINARLGTANVGINQRKDTLGLLGGLGGRILGAVF